MNVQHLPLFIQDLALILMTAGLTSILCRWFKQPVILGYVLAGILVGPHVSLTATISDFESVKVWGEIGVIFVLFSLGLEFSFRRLLHLGGASAVTASIETSLLLLMGTLLGLIFGWERMDAIFLGGMLCISSTMIIMKLFDEMNLKSRGFTQLVVGILIVEDLVAVLLLVVLSTLAATRDVSGGDLAVTALRLVFFLVLWFVIGLFVLPGLMRVLRKLFTTETTLIFSVGLCLMMVLVATKSGFSPALGAFVMGSLLAETDEGHRIELVIHPLRHFFGAIFFVSVGILFDPFAMVDYWPIVLAVTLLLIAGKTIAVSAGAILAGQSTKNALRAGLSMTQIGEFSYIIASLGLSLKVISSHLFPIAVGVSLVSSMLTPFLLKRADGLHDFLERHMPVRVRGAIEGYQAAVQSRQGTMLISGLFRAYGPLVLVNTVLVLATTSLVRFVAYPQIEYWLGAGSGTRLIGLMLDLLLCLPFFWGLCMRRAGREWRGRAGDYQRIRLIEIALAFARISFGFILFLVIVAQYLSWRSFSGITLTVFLVSGLLFYTYGGRIYRRLERRFLGQLSKPDEREAEPPLLPWDTHLTELTVAPDSPACGMTIAELGLQEAFGVMIAAISRGHKRILAPKAGDQLFPGDRLSVIGGDSDIERLRRLIESGEDGAEDEIPLRLQSVILDPRSKLCGKAIRDSGLRELVDGLLVGLERQGYRKLNPPADLRLEAGDRLWIVGDPDKISALNS